MPTPLDDATLRRYLLGELPESEAESLEEAYFADAEAQALVREAEDDLLDDYAAARLGPGERQAFERRCLVTPPQRERLRAARALRLLASDVPARRRARFWPAFGALAAVFLLSVVALRVWPPQTPPDVPAPASAARVESPAPPVAAPAAAEAQPPARPTPATFTIALAPLLTRSQGETPQVRIPPRASEVLLEFQGEPGSLPARSRWRASLATVEGRESWHGRAEARADPARPTLLAVARVPAVALKPDDYIATLAAEGGAEDEPSFRYFIRVVE